MCVCVRIVYAKVTDALCCSASMSTDVPVTLFLRLCPRFVLVCASIKLLHT